MGTPATIALLVILCMIALAIDGSKYLDKKRREKHYRDYKDGRK